MSNPQRQKTKTYRKQRTPTRRVARQPSRQNCYRCGRPVLVVPTATGDRTCVGVPQRDPDGPWALVGPVAQWDPHHTINTTNRLTPHKCGTRCRYCGETINVLSRPPGHPGERLVVVDATPTVDGIWQLDRHGWAVPREPDDPDGYRWHTRHPALAERTDEEANDPITDRQETP